MNWVFLEEISTEQIHLGYISKSLFFREYGENIMSSFPA